MNSSGIKAMMVSIANDPAFFQPVFLKVLEVRGQPLIGSVQLCDCPSALSLPFSNEGELKELTSDSTGSNSRREASSFSGMKWEWFRKRSICGMEQKG